jgi:uncharacterized protein (TIGR02391 family)
MNLQTHIHPELWQALAGRYQNEDYKNAILDAMRYLSDLLRNKTNLSGDGVALVGQALGGNAPKLRLNKLQTQTEKDVQKGFEQLLRGLYQGIRNPRTHEQNTDDQETADAIIYFINYLLGILDQSEEVFTIEKFIASVLDPDFVPSEQYAQLLIQEIPIKKQLDTLITIHRRKTEGDGKKLVYMVRELLNRLQYDEVQDFLRVVSDELKTTQDEDEIRLALQILPPDLWLRIDEVARMRIENKLIKSIQEGVRPIPHEWNSDIGVLGTWARDYIKYFTLKSQLGETLRQKLASNRSIDVRYAVDFFWNVLPDTITQDRECQAYIRVISEAIVSNNSIVRDAFNGNSLDGDLKKGIEEKLSRADYDAFEPPPPDPDDIPF